MTSFQLAIFTALLGIWFCTSTVFLISTIQSFIYDRRHEKRERAREERERKNK